MKTKPKNIAFLLIVMVLLSLVVSACKNGTQTLDIDAQKTAFAQTAEAQASMTIAAQPSATPTATQAATSTPTPTETLTDGTVGPTPTATIENTTVSTPINGKDEAVFRDQNIEDNTEFSPGEKFTLIWKLENIGTSTWTTNYYIEFTSGDQMDAEENVYLPYPVPPGTNVEISVDFTAPGETGDYKSVWSLVNANDEVFYTNFYIEIKVVEN